MRTFRLELQNLKCGGCANTITKTIAKPKAVDNIFVSPDTGEVSFDLGDEALLEGIKADLASKGYPVVGESNSLGQKVKSYVSCAVGRVS